jgi:glycosyltransferase involved in cell wall biosynthesis
MKSVLFPYTHTAVGGSYISSSLLVKHLHALSDWDVRVCLPRRGLNAPIFEFDGFRPDYLNTKIMSESGLRHKSLAHRLPAHIQAYRLAISYLRNHRPDLVHVNDTKTQLIWGWAARRLKIPVVFHVRNVGKTGMDRYCLPLANHLIIVSDAVRGRLEGYRKLPPHETIHNAVGFDTFYPPRSREEYRMRLGLNPGRLTLGFVGNLLSRKRPEWAVKAAVELLERGSDVQLVVVGEDKSDGRTYERRLKAMVEEAGVSEHVHFLGYRDDVPDVMRALDMLLLASTEKGEGFPRVVIEAMASGAAVVATRVAGVPEAFTDGVSGLMADPDDYSAFAQAVRALAEDDALRRDIACRGHEEALARFSVATCGERVIAVYNKVLGDKVLGDKVLGG